MARRIALIFGGRSSEHEVSLRSAAEVLDALDRGRFEPVLVGMGRDGELRTGPARATLAEIVASGERVDDLRALGPEVVFPLLHGPYGEDGTVQGMLELLDLPYVGSGVAASALCMDKAITKLIAAAAGVPVVPGLVLTPALGGPGGAAEGLDGLREYTAVHGFPLFVKPANQGSSVGVSRASDPAELDAAISLAARYDDKVVVERGVNAREIELAVLGSGGPDTLVSGPGEITLPEGGWYDYDTKYVTDAAGLEIPARIDPSLTQQLRDLALTTFRAVGAHGLARLDFLVDRQTGEPFLNEVNTMPGFTSISMYPKLIEAAGIGYTDLITRLCELALERHRHRATLSTSR